MSYILMKCIVVIFFAAHMMLAQTQKLVSGSISGAVREAKSKNPIPAALVMATRILPSPFTQRTKSGGDGEYQLRGLPPGDYLVCAQAPSSQHLNSCEWGGGGIGIVIGSVPSAVGIDIALAPASVLNVQLADPRGALLQMTKDGRRPELLIGVWGPRGMYYAAREASGQMLPAGGRDQAASYTFQITVPRDTTLRLDVVSRDLKLGDANGLALTEAASRPSFQLSTGDAKPSSFSFTVLEKMP